jgi:hypothetical protein
MQREDDPQVVEKLVDQNIACWNQTLLWLRRVNTIRHDAA